MCPIIQSMNDKDPLATSGLPSLERLKQRKDDTKQGEVVNQPSGGRFLILVVDDSADNVAVMSLHLQDQGYRVVTASNGCLLYTSPSPRDGLLSRMPSSA